MSEEKPSELENHMAVFLCKNDTPCLHHLAQARVLKQMVLDEITVRLTSPIFTSV